MSLKDKYPYLFSASGEPPDDLPNWHEIDMWLFNEIKKLQDELKKLRERIRILENKFEFVEAKR